MKRLLVFSVIILSAMWGSNLSYAQTGVMRVEFPAELEKNPYEVAPLEDYGLLMFYAQPELIGEVNRSWHFTLYDTNLFIQWEADIPILDGARYKGYHLEDSTLYLFFFNPGKSKSTLDNYQVSALEITSGIIDHFTGYLPEVDEVRGFLVQDGTAIIACDLLNEQVGVYLIEIQRQSTRSYVTDFPDQNFLEDLQYDSYSGSLLVIISNFVSRKQNRLLLLRLGMNGDLLGSYPVEVVLPSKYLNSARVYSAGPAEYMVIGTYSNFASKIPGKNEYFGLESAGFFITRFEDGAQQFMNYYNFMELQNLRPAMSARDYLKLAKRKNRNEEEYSADYEMTMRPISSENNQFIIMAEAFYPDFRTVSDISYDYWGRPITHTYTVFEGYRIFQSLLLGFDIDGNLLWDNSLELSNIKTLDLSFRSGYHFEGKPAVLYFNDGIKVSFSAFAGNALIEGVNYSELDTSYRGDKIVELGNNYMEPWYDGYYLCYGYHTIRNNLLAEQEMRTVFYINKIIFE
jgi:hypothetical protein